MPFRCKCGRTFEKTETFASHTSACSAFHERRLSDASQQISNSLLTEQRRFSDSTLERQLSSSLPTSGFFMPTALSIQNVFEGARRRSMSINTNNNNNTTNNDKQHQQQN